MNPADHGARHRARASVALEIGRYAVAEREARAALAADPRDLSAQLYLCRAYLGLRAYPQAIDSAASALQLSPNDGYAHYLHGYALHAAGKSRDAVTALRQAVAFHPSAPRYYARLAIAHLDTNEHDDARRVIKIALDLDAEQSVLLDEAARVFGLLGDLDDAESCARKVLNLTPNDAATHWRLAWVLALKKHFVESSESARAALRIDPNYWPAWEELGYVLLELKRDDQAQWALREALRLNPGLTSATLNLAYCYERSGYLDDAVDACDDALNTGAPNARVRTVRDRLEQRRRQRTKRQQLDRVRLVLAIVSALSLGFKGPLGLQTVLSVVAVVALVLVLRATYRPAPRAPLSRGEHRP